MRPLVMILSTSILLWVPVAAQEPQSPFVLRVNTQLVVRTVFVKDKDGHPIEGLTAGDFVLTEDGVRQTLSVFEFQKMDDTPVASTLPLLPSTVDGRPVEPRNTSRPAARPSGEIRYKDRRLLAFYFDLGATSETERARALGAAKEFIEAQMTFADLVAILTYSGGAVRLIRDFTDNRARLLETISALLDRDYQDEDAADPAFGQNEGEFDIFSTDRRLMALQTAARMLGPLSEAKSLIYFASGVGLNVENQAQLRATLNAAVRANVSIYPIDSRGLSAFAPMGNANEGSPGGIAMYTGASAIERMGVFQQSQDALYTLAADTGGKALLNYNDLSLGIVQAQRATSSYYILGYYPTNTAQDGRLRQVEISLKGRSADLSYRQAYYANKDFSKFTAADKERQLEDALLLEDPITELTIAMELNYFQLNRAEYFVPLAAKIPGSELVFAQKAGADRTVIDFIGEIRDEFGTTITNLRDKVEIKLNGEVLSRLASSPIQYDTGFTLLPGKYMLKFLVRNADTGRIGTYQTTFVVPDLNKEELRLPISSVVLSSQRVAMTDALFDAGKDKAARAQTANPLVQDGQKLIPSITRVFSKIRPLHVYLEAYERNAVSTEVLVAFVTFYQEQEKVFETPAFEINDPLDAKSKAVPIRFTIALGELPIGEYTCQVTVLHPMEQKVAFWQTQVLIVP